MNSFELMQSNLLSPMVLAFVLGAIATLVKSDLKLPDGLYLSLSMYLLFAIGLKGGVALSESTLSELALPIVGTLVLGLLTPVIGYNAARRFGKLSTIDSAALAAHYGSVSAVTFIAAVTFAQNQGIKTEGFMPALVALLEIPAILVALGLALRKQPGAKFGILIHELLTGKAILLLMGGLVIGAICGTKGVEQVSPLFGDLFKGALTIFLLEMGLVAAQRFGDLKQHALLLGLYGTILPLVNGCLGVVIGTWCGLSVGGAGVLGAMAASASYIAAPAAVRIVLPSANPGLYLTGPLAVTFPFNLAIGIPLFQQISLWMHSR